MNDIATRSVLLDLADQHRVGRAIQRQIGQMSSPDHAQSATQGFLLHLDARVRLAPVDDTGNPAIAPQLIGLLADNLARFCFNNDSLTHALSTLVCSGLEIFGVGTCDVHYRCPTRVLNECGQLI